MPRAAALLVLGALLALGGCKKPEEPVFPDNRCSANRDCWEGTRCFTEVNLCARDEAEVPYAVVVQVDPAGAEGRHTFAAFVLEESSLERALELPESLTIEGAIKEGSKLIPAEIVFHPVAEPGLPVSPAVITSRPGADAASNFSVTLPPATDFLVTMQPLGPDSELYPPATAEFATGTKSAPFAYEYTGLERLEQVLMADDEPAAGHRVRLMSTRTGRVVSSTVETDLDGSFALAVHAGELERGEYVLQVNLDPDDPWRELIEIAPDRIDRRADDALREPIVMPRVPGRVLFRGYTEARQLEGAPNVEVTFLSSFPVPNLTGDLRDRNWCRARDSKDTRSPFVCRTTRSAASDPQGDFAIELLPGDYEVFISPGPESYSKQRVATSKFLQGIETQPAGGAIGPRLFDLRTATRLTGSVYGLDNELLPNVVVRTAALGLVGTLSDVAAYNRPGSSVSDQEGRFTLSVDEGYYDVIAEPPQGSGYPPVYQINRFFDPDRSEMTIDRALTLRAPVVLAGSVSTAAGELLPNASIDAFAVVNDLRGGKRALLIGRTTSDEEGNYLLPLPPRMEERLE